MRQIWIAVVISAGMLAGCSSGTTVVPDAEPKVVDTLCDYHKEGFIVFGVYEDGSVKALRDEDGDVIICRD